MGTDIADLTAQHEELDAMLEGLDVEGWRQPSPCEGWDVSDVVLHLAQTDEMAIGSVQGRLDEVVERLTVGIGAATNVDDGAAFMVERERDRSTDQLWTRWRTGAAELREVLKEADPHDRVMWVAGELSVRTLATTRLAESWIHTGDVAAALGRQRQPTDRLRPIARLAWRTLPYAFGRAGRTLTGPVAFELRGPSGEQWSFVPDDPPLTTIRGEAVDLCTVAARRATPEETTLIGDGPDTEAVLELVRTYA
jgi:uncharacterized protein (TIGR03084 family)